MENEISGRARDGTQKVFLSYRDLSIRTFNPAARNTHKEKKMNHYVWYAPEANVGIIEVKGEFKYEDINPTFEKLEKECKTKDYYSLLIDLSDSDGELSEISSTALIEHIQSKHCACIAFVDSKSSDGTVAKTIVAASNVETEKRFFNTPSEAWKWLRDVS
jgi:hypothetical protein